MNLHIQHPATPGPVVVTDPHRDFSVQTWLMHRSLLSHAFARQLDFKGGDVGDRCIVSHCMYKYTHIYAVLQSWITQPSIAPWPLITWLLILLILGVFELVQFPCSSNFLDLSSEQIKKKQSCTEGYPASNSIAGTTPVEKEP